MRIRIITSCTGKKIVSSARQLTLDDFLRGAAFVRSREAELSSALLPAISLYSGEQHLRLLRGIAAIAANPGADIDVETWILSAGYGLIPAERAIAPYEATFIGMNARHAWARKLAIPASFQRELSRPADLILILLGESYLDVVGLDEHAQLGGPSIVLCGSRAASCLPTIPDLKPIGLNNDHARRFSCGSVGLKGEIARRILVGLAQGRFTIPLLMTAERLLDLL